MNEITLDRIGQWPFALKLSIFVVIFLTVLLFCYRFFIENQLAKYSQLEREEAILKEEFEQKQLKAVNLKRLKRELELTQQHVARITLGCKAKNKISNLLEQITHIGQILGLQIELFSPLEEIQYQSFIKLPVRMKFSGSYYQTAAFLSRIAQMKHAIVSIGDFTLQKIHGGSRVEQGCKDKLSMDLTVVIYRFANESISSF